MNGGLSSTRRLPRALMIAALAAMTLLLMMNLGGCGKKQQEAEIKTAPEQPAMEEPVKVTPPEEIPVKQEETTPTEMAQPAVDLKPVFFDFDKYELRPTAREALNANGRMMKDNPNLRIIIEGHCDERGTVQYNLALGEKRAQAAKSYLVDLGVAPSRMDVVSYGKERPFAMGHDEAAWAQNRRAQFVPRPSSK